ncbi:helix-turn-helix domain-containing protein [Hoeflea sp. AS60]|uniref:AraC-like ligand-binding domain-containing protein n=1 Tax=Hoeflea sp. AS60 TaxID=3135780 RepID=UPI003179996B
MEAELIETGIHLTTNTVHQRDRFAFWREAVCDTYVRLECTSNAQTNFVGEIRLNRMPRISTSFVSGSQQLVRRRKRDIGQASDDWFLLSIQLEKQGLVEQCGRRAELGYGDFALYSSSEPYDLTLPDGFRQLVVQIPKAEMLQRLPNADLLTGMTVSGATQIGGLVRDSVLRLVEAQASANAITSRCLEDSIIDLCATGLTTLRGAGDIRTASEQRLIHQADTIIAQRLRDPELDRAEIAAALSISIRRLSEVFQAEGTSVASKIREQRLAGVASDLRNPQFAGWTVSAIAMRWGLNNLQHFSRIFREQFGVSPRDYRALGLIGGCKTPPGAYRQE